MKAEVYTKTFTPLKANLTAKGDSDVNNPQKAFVKLLAEQGSGRVLGLHMVGHDAPEIVQVLLLSVFVCVCCASSEQEIDNNKTTQTHKGFSLAVKHNLTKHQLNSLVGVHPTSAEEVLGLKECARVVGE